MAQGAHETARELNKSSYLQKLKIIDNFVDEAQRRIEQGSREISCRRGCSHCCKMMVEVTWEEALLLARWVRSRMPERRRKIHQKIRRAAADRRKFFTRRKSTEHFLRPTRSAREISDRAAEEYFHEKSRTCPFLENDVCTVYSRRPAACRMHMVVSPPRLCSRKNSEEEEFVVPGEMEKVRDKIETDVYDGTEDGRWGELAIMVDHAIRELDAAGAPRRP